MHFDIFLKETQTKRKNRDFSCFSDIITSRIPKIDTILHFKNNAYF